MSTILLILCGNIPEYPMLDRSRIFHLTQGLKKKILGSTQVPGEAGLQSKVISTASSSLGMKKQCKMGNVIGQISGQLGSSAGKFGGARWDKLQLSVRNLKFQHVSPCFNLWVSVSIFQYSPCHSFTILSRALSRPMSCMSFWLCLSPSWNNHIHYYPWRPKTASSPVNNIENDDSGKIMLQTWIYQTPMVQKMILPISH